MANESSAARVAGVNFLTFYYKGSQYVLSQPLLMGSYMDEESIVLWKRNSPGKFAVEMMDKLPLNYHQGVLNAAAVANNGGIPTEEEWTNYGRSMWKKAFMLWVCLDPHHKADPKTGQKLALIDGLNWCLKILYDAAVSSTAVGRDLVAEIEQKCHIVSQEAAIKNWCGPTDQGVSEGPTETETPLPLSPSEAGPGYSSTSPENTP